MRSIGWFSADEVIHVAWPSFTDLVVGVRHRLIDVEAAVDIALRRWNLTGRATAQEQWLASTLREQRDEVIDVLAGVVSSDDELKAATEFWLRVGLTLLLERTATDRWLYIDDFGDSLGVDLNERGLLYSPYGFGDDEETVVERIRLRYGPPSS